jgi:ABC-type antimicrobial peptide transport system permease subunit
VGLGELLKSEIFTVRPLDPRLYAAAALVMGVTVMLSTLAPALAAARMDPNAALRSE